MSVVSGERHHLLVPCSSSSSTQEKEQNHVVIHYPGYDKKLRTRAILVCVPVDRLIPSKTLSPPPSDTKLEQMLPRSEGFALNSCMRCICTSTVGAGKTSSGSLYFFGGWAPPARCSSELAKQYVVKDAYRYDLHKLPEKVGKVVRCKDMIAGMLHPLLAQVGDDCIYALGYGKTTTQDDDDNSPLKPAFQEYNFKKDEWTLLSDDDNHHFVDMINNCDCDKLVRDNLDCIPHVVIGRKLHVSLGNSSFTFDTVEHVWGDCKLFETFWTSKKTKKSGLSPTNFYGREVCCGAVDQAEKKRKRKRNKNGGGPPFGFSERGILWDKNILIGVHYAPNCPLVAFLLDEDGRVVKSQRLSLNNLALDRGKLSDGARLVDLGRDDGYFGLVHTLIDFKNYIHLGANLRMELVTLKVKRIGAAPDDDGDFLECKVMRKEFVAKGFADEISHLYHAFCV